MFIDTYILILKKKKSKVPTAKVTFDPVLTEGSVVWIWKILMSSTSSLAVINDFHKLQTIIYERADIS